MKVTFLGEVPLQLFDWGTRPPGVGAHAVGAFGTRMVTQVISFRCSATWALKSFRRFMAAVGGTDGS